MGELLCLLIEGVALAPVVLLAGGVALWCAYRWRWRRPRWVEAMRHQHTLWVAVERWLRFRWVHRDCLYWELPVRLDRGEIELDGLPPDCLWWCLTWYEGTEVNASVASHEVTLDADGRYRVRMGPAVSGHQALRTRPGARHAVISLRIYEPAHMYPSRLPRVTQAGRRISAGGPT